MKKVIKTLAFVMLLVTIATGCKKSKEVSMTITLGDITENEAAIKGTAYGKDLDLTSDDCYVTDLGFCYNTTGNPTINDKTLPAFLSVTPKNDFYKTLRPLEPNTTYYVRAYAKSDDYYYSNELHFTTEVDANMLPNISLSIDEIEILSGETVTFRIDAQSVTSVKLSEMELTITDDDENVVYTTKETGINSTNFSKEYSLQFTGAPYDYFILKATIKDESGLSSSTEASVFIENTALWDYSFTWTRIGANAGTGLEDFGLKWVQNSAKATYAVIEPLDGTKLCRLNVNDWNEIQSPYQKQVAIDNAGAIQYWKEFNVAGAMSQTFDVVLGTHYNNQYYLIHITNGEVTYGSPVQYSITGKAK